MVICAYCKRPATDTIVAIPHRVCLEHAVEFWTGLLRYSQGRSGPCVKDTTLCACAACEARSEAEMRSRTLRSARPSPGDHEDFAIGLAS
jgi:hypothetical protein